MRVISLDIDGTMTFGDPPGKIPPEWAKAQKERGNIVGSASDRPVSDQLRLWRENGLEPDFVVLKHLLDEIKEKFPADEYWHVGDSQVDKFYSTKAGFEFFWVNQFVEDGRFKGTL